MNSNIYETLGITKETMIKLAHKDIRNIFHTMICIGDIMPIPIQIDPQSHFTDCVTAIVGFAGHFTGLLNLHVPKSLALRFTSSMLGIEVTKLNSDVDDALGEIANMIAGSLKHHLSKDGHEVRLSIPSIVTGDEYIISSALMTNALTLLYDTYGEWFMVSLSAEIE